jgi:hypothetical protein
MCREANVSVTDQFTSAAYAVASRRSVASAAAHGLILIIHASWGALFTRSG